MRKQQEMMLKENAWKGRSAGLDIAKTGGPQTDSKLRKKGGQRGELPPLGLDSEGSMVSELTFSVRVLILL